MEPEPSAAPEVSDETSDVESEIQHCTDDDKLQELNQQVESLQSVILQVSCGKILVIKLVLQDSVVLLLLLFCGFPAISVQKRSCVVSLWIN